MQVSRLIRRLKPGVCAWTARAIAYERDEELNYEMLALGETPEGERRVLMVQRGLTFDEQDIELGEDTYCLVAEDGRTHYGGVTR